MENLTVGLTEKKAHLSDVIPITKLADTAQLSYLIMIIMLLFAKSIIIKRITYKLHIEHLIL